MSCKVCGAREDRHSISARNFDELQAPGTVWHACRRCCAEDHRRAGIAGRKEIPER